MTDNRPKISIIIVNYNVRDFLEQSLISLKRALKQLESEIIVVDNASFDGSEQMLNKRFPEVKLIKNTTNAGFSAANNQALNIARGEFIVLINPDTVVQEDTFTKLLDFFDHHPDASAATCKILNPDGTFSVDCRHSIPTPATAFWKLIGFNRLFPKSRIFGKYNLTYLDENETYAVEAISGSFMMMKRDVVEEVGQLDERFFMYCEDIDYCHRINKAGGRIYYVPTSQIIHYKGESTKKNNIDYIITFNKSLYLFYKKHYKQKYIYPFEWLILLGVILRGTLIFFKNMFRQYYPFFTDLVILNILMSLSFYIRYELKGGFVLNEFLTEHIILNIITSIAYFLSSLFFDSLNKHKYSIIKLINSNLVTFTIASAFTFFFRQFAFSRLIILVAAVLSPIFMVGWRLLLNYYGRKHARLFGKDLFLKRAFIVGFDKETENLLSMLRKRSNSGIEIAGVIALNTKDIGKKLGGFEVVGSIERLPQSIKSNKVNLVIFSTHNLSFERILNTMSEVQNPGVEFKMVPGHLEFMIGKSTIERLDSFPLVEIDYAYGKPFNMLIKRFTDIVLAVVILLPMTPIFIIQVLSNRGDVYKLPVGTHPDRGNQKYIYWTDKKGMFRFLLHLTDIIRGRLSFVGAPIEEKHKTRIPFEYKPGITGIVQINKDHVSDDEALENLVVHYLKNQNFFLDIEIMLKSVFRK